MKSNPEKVLKRFWDKAINEYWLTLADAAPDPMWRYHYLNQIAKMDLRITPLTELHDGVKGETMFCEVCFAEYGNVHPDKPAFCANGHNAVQVRRAKDIVAIQKATEGFFARRMAKR